MSVSRIEELKKQRQRQTKKKSSQLPYAIVVIALAIIVCIISFNYNTSYSLLWIIGIFIGITLQRSRFCFAASFRDPVLVGSTSILRAIIIALIVSTIGFAIIQHMSIGDIQNLDISTIPGQIKPVGIHTIVGAIIFGIGMVIAGGCASGTLMRIGEGFQLQLVVLIGFIIGSLMGARTFEFWHKVFVLNSPTVYFPQYVGFPMAVIGQIVVLIILYYLASWYHKKNNIMSM